MTQLPDAHWANAALGEAVKRNQAIIISTLIGKESEGDELERSQAKRALDEMQPYLSRTPVR